ncbi:MAG: ABC transporter ATP-binding protein, partial [Candidatus Didemnitutus sp.]|nr:ABC transporter ATP-binding protein [Candidatus Didemnitutus sp.]
YLGKIVEFGPANEVIERPGHPYSQALISAIPSIDPTTAPKRVVLAGDPPSPRQPPSGCAFHPRCPHVQAQCREITPRLTPITPAHAAACVRLGEF